jgi:carbonic anhydrase
MTIQSDLIARNETFASGFDQGDLEILPKLRTVILTCADARVDPAHIFGLDLGEAVIIRNNGGRVTRAVVEEIAVLAVLVDAASEGRENGFNVVLMQHTNCGAQRFANPDLQAMIKKKLGIDVSEYAITDQATDLLGDIGRLVDAPEVPDTIVVSAVLYDVSTGTVEVIAPEKSLGALRAETPAVGALTAT